MNDVIISPCSAGDIPDLTTIAVTTYKQHYHYLWHDSGAAYVAGTFNPRSLHHEFNEQGTAFYMIYFQGELVGYLKLNLQAALAGKAEGDCLELESLYLLQEVTGKGIGRQVLDFTLRLARTKNRRFVWLKVMASSNQAIRFYEKPGFVKCHTLVLDMPQVKEEFWGMNVMSLDMEQPVAGRESSAIGNVVQKVVKKELTIG